MNSTLRANCPSASELTLPFASRLSSAACEEQGGSAGLGVRQLNCTPSLGNHGRAILKWLMNGYSRV